MIILIVNKTSIKVRDTNMNETETENTITNVNENPYIDLNPKSSIVLKEIKVNSEVANNQLSINFDAILNNNNNSNHDITKINKEVKKVKILIEDTDYTPLVKQEYDIEHIYHSNNADYYRKRIVADDNTDTFVYYEKVKDNMIIIKYEDMNMPNKDIVKEDELLIKGRTAVRGSQAILRAVRTTETKKIPVWTESILLGEEIPHAPIDAIVSEKKIIDINEKQLSLIQYANKIYEHDKTLDIKQSMLLVIKGDVHLDDMKSIVNPHEIVNNSTKGNFVIYIRPSELDNLKETKLTDKILAASIPLVSALKINMSGITEERYNSQGLVQSYLTLQIGYFSSNSSSSFTEYINSTFGENKILDLGQNYKRINIEGYKWKDIMDFMDVLALFPHVYELLLLFIS
jgi:hypothetical protein